MRVQRLRDAAGERAAVAELVEEARLALEAIAANLANARLGRLPLEPTTDAAIVMADRIALLLRVAA